MKYREFHIREAYYIPQNRNLIILCNLFKSFLCILRKWFDFILIAINKYLSDLIINVIASCVVLYSSVVLLLISVNKWYEDRMNKSKANKLAILYEGIS